MRDEFNFIIDLPNSGGCKHVEPRIQSQGFSREVYGEQGDTGPRLLWFLTANYKFVNFMCNYRCPIDLRTALCWDIMRRRVVFCLFVLFLCNFLYFYYFTFYLFNFSPFYYFVHLVYFPSLLLLHSIHFSPITFTFPHQAVARPPRDRFSPR
jgi:hypothetical protein